MADLEQFQSLMAAGADAAWNRNWRGAIEAYSEALEIMPNDPDAHVNLGIALQNTNKLEQALKLYERATQLAPNDPVPLERYAEALEAMKQPEEAAHQYIQVAEAYAKQRDLLMAINNWERAADLQRGLISVHAHLAQAYEKIGDKQQVVRQYLLLAHGFQANGDDAKAGKALERVLRVDKNNAAALNGLRALRAGREINLPDGIFDRPKQTKSDAQPEMDLFNLMDDTPEIGEAHPAGPIGEAMEHALELLAAHVVESGLNDYIMFAMQGMESQRQEDAGNAIAAYQQAIEAGLRHPSLQMCLGGLLVQNEQPQDSLMYLGEATQQPSLASGAFHAIGQAHYQLGDHKKASRYLIQSLQAVDTELASSDSEIEDLRSVYDSLMIALEDRTPEALQVINSRFLGLLSGADWKQRIAETRRHLDETLRDEGDQGLVDFLVAKGSDELADIVSQIDRFIRRGLYTLAMDTSHRAVEKSPYYLPLHVRMAEIMMKEGRIRQAINKYNTVARAYLVREENDRAASILEEVLEMAPLDVKVRLNLIELLEGENRISEALEQYIDLAETYQQLGDFDRASQTFVNAEGLAREIGASPEKRTQIKHYMADINQMRLNTREAQKIYEEILEILPHDEQALRSLIEIYYTQGNQVEAVKRLDALLGMYAQSGEIDKIVRLLEQLVHSNPADIALRKRLSSIYRKRGQRRESIEQLDALGELQLDAGLTKEAAQTIRQIISLNPDRVDEYKRLLQQLGG